MFTFLGLKMVSIKVIQLMALCIDDLRMKNPGRTILSILFPHYREQWRQILKKQGGDI